MIKGAFIFAVGISFGFSAGLVAGVVLNDNQSLSESFKKLTQDNDAKAWNPISSPDVDGESDLVE